MATAWVPIPKVFSKVTFLAPTLNSIEVVAALEQRRVTRGRSRWHLDTLVITAWTQFIHEALGRRVGRRLINGHLHSLEIARPISRHNNVDVRLGGQRKRPAK